VLRTRLSIRCGYLPLLLLPAEHDRVRQRSPGAATVAGIHGYEALTARLPGVQLAAVNDGRPEAFAALLRAPGPIPRTRLERDE